MEKTLKICMAGFGNLGKRFAQLLLEKEEYLLEEYGCRFCITGISTRTRGTLVDPDGIDVGNALDMIAQTGRFSPDSRGYTEGGSVEMINNCGADIFIELSTLSVADGQPAADYIRLALENGMHVITANKGPEVWHYKELKQLADEKGLMYLYETTVMGGAPLFSLMRECLHGNRLLGFKGILNGTSNYVLCSMEKGNSYSQAIKEAQQIGIAEADPSIDMGGFDGAVKLCALANIFMGCSFTPDNIEITSLENITAEEIAAARREGFKIKYICQAMPDEKTGRITAKISPEKLPASDLLCNVESNSLAITLYTDLAGELTLVSSGAEMLQIVFGIYSDLLTLLKHLKNS
ncbi:MAG: hypothetical protein IJN27_06155 [Oscillospiraceae bacterium]|nr:hypothetical protein [Oscillospiraceae bacterium]